MKNRLKSLVFIFSCLCMCSFAQKESSYFKKLQTQRVESSNLVTWNQIGPGMSGYCEEFWCHPTDVNTMFMSPDMYNSYGSWDGGKSWHTIKDCDGDGQDMRRVQSITFSHQNPNLGYAITVTGALYKTTDKGYHWVLQDFKSQGRCSELAVDPTNDKIWYMGGGDFWNVKKNHRTKAGMEDRYKGYFAPYVRYGAMLRSVDGGKTWKSINKGLPETKTILLGKKKLKIGFEVGRIIIDPTNNKNVIAITNFGVYRSNNQGNSWESSATGLPNNMPRDIDYFYDKKSGEFILYLLEQTDYSLDNGKVTCKGGIYKSIDHGKSWTSISGDLAIDFSRITDYSYINKYNTAMSNWFSMNKKDFSNKYKQRPSNLLSIFNRLRVNPINKDEIYISENTKHDMGFIPSDVWKTENGGKHWSAVTRFSSYWSKGKDNEYWKSRLNPVNKNVKFAHLQPNVDVRGQLIGNRFMEINSKGDVFICLEQQVISSVNGGKTWEEIDDNETSNGSKCWIGRGGSNLPGRFILLETGIKDRILLCSGEHGLWESRPYSDVKDKKTVAVKQLEGQVHVKGAHSIASVAVDPNDPNTIYTLQFRQEHRGAFRCTHDGGKTWKNLSVPLKYGGNISSDNIFQSSLIIDPKDSKRIYFVNMKNPISDVSSKNIAKYVKEYGVFKSEDGGYTWKMANNGLNLESGVRRIAMDPKNSSVLYAALNSNQDGTAKGGLYITKDRAETWSKIKIPSQIKAVNNVFIDKKSGVIYIACGTETSTIDEGGVWRSNDNGKTWTKIFFMPYIWQVETSPLNPNIITVSVAKQHSVKGSVLYNPGAYLSLDCGKTWNKINNNLGQPDRVVELKPDNRDQNKFWCALMGSGWAVGYLNR